MPATKKPAARRTTSASRKVVGTGDFTYELDASWPKVPDFWELGICSDVAVDSKDRVWVFNRGKHPVTCWTASGDFVGSWGEGGYRMSHGLFIDPKDNIWLTDAQRHVVEKRTLDGTLIMELGDRDYANVTVSQKGDNGKPFNMPSGVALNKKGEIYVSDGYGNRRIHRFSPSGELVQSWGRSGDGPGEFALPHNIGIDPKGRVFVCDRENSRIQVFDPNGEFITMWTDLLSPGDVYFGRDNMCYVVEQGRPTGISIFTLDGELVSRWRGGPSNPVVEAPHGIWADSKGDLYVAEIGQPGHGQRVRKFVRR